MYSCRTNKIKQAVHGQESTAEVFLFGSRSRGDYKENSDWDILVLLPEDVPLKTVEQKIISALYEIELGTGQVVDPIIYSKQNWHQKQRVTPFYEQVMSENVSL